MPTLLTILLIIAAVNVGYLFYTKRAPFIDSAKLSVSEVSLLVIIFSAGITASNYSPKADMVAEAPPVAHVQHVTMN